jgi:hypothetical protein
MATRFIVKFTYNLSSIYMFLECCAAGSQYDESLTIAANAQIVERVEDLCHFWKEAASEMSAEHGKVWS